MKGKNDILKPILEAVTISTKIPTYKIIIKNNKRDASMARHIYCYFAKYYTGYSLRKIGEFVSRDHATVIHSCKAIEKLLFTKEEPYLTWIYMVKWKLDGQSYAVKDPVTRVRKLAIDLSNIKDPVKYYKGLINLLKHDLELLEVQEPKKYIHERNDCAV